MQVKLNTALFGFCFIIALMNAFFSAFGHGQASGYAALAGWTSASLGWLMALLLSLSNRRDDE